jgi:phenazine biosynthesis protein phzE
MDLLSDLLTTVSRGAPPGPFALLCREGRAHLEVFAGEVSTADRLADLPLGGARGPHTLAVIPYRQIAERGFACVDDGVPLEFLRIQRSAEVPLARAIKMLAPPRTLEPRTPRGASAPAGEEATPRRREPPERSEGQPAQFDVPDDEYAATVDAVLREDIGRGAGANFVIHRAYTSTLDGDPLPAALSALRRLLEHERGAYWTFLVHTGARTLVGATPERHVSVEDGLVMKNPISGTHRHGMVGPDVDDVLRFLADRKEIDELYMVLDEELKMMAAVAERGGQVIGPYLKEMSHLMHTEYLLAGRGSRDVREVLRETMFAPTVTGSPIENACRVIARHEGRGRRYYAGALALLGHDGEGRQSLDSAILIRTAEIDPHGRVRVPVGATLVRHSTAAGEVAETHTKAAGVLAALGLGPAAPTTPAAATAVDRAAATAVDRAADDPRVRAALAERNRNLAPFWLHQHAPGAIEVPALAGRRVLVVDGEDTFTGMFAHQLRALGLHVAVRRWDDAGPDEAGADLVVAGPGPGDPGDPADPKMAVLRRLVIGRLSAGRPLLAVCLGHQILAAHLGLTLHRRDAPYQGLQREIELFGRVRRVGFYSTFTAESGVDELATAYGRVELARDPADGAVHALRGGTFAGLQFHPESVLSEHGLEILADLLPAIMTRQSLPREELDSLDDVSEAVADPR